MKKLKEKIDLIHLSSSIILRMTVFGRDRSSVLLIREQDSTQRTVDKYKILLEVSKQLSSPDDTHRLSEKILDLLFEIMKVDRAVILKLLDHNTQELECKAFKSRHDPPEPQNFYSKRIVKDVLENGKSILTADALRDIGSDSIVMQSIRSAMCVPLKPRDEVIGVLYVDSLSRGNIYTEEDLEFLTALANQAAIAIDNMQLHKQILEDVVARHEMEIGRKIQRDFLPDTMPQLPGWEFAATFTPATQVSGDFYDFFTLPSGDIGLAIGDVSEHGVGSALFMALFRSLIRVFSTNTYLDNGSSESLNGDKPPEDWQITCIRFAPNAPEQNPVEDIWLFAKRFVRSCYYLCKSFDMVKSLFVDILHGTHFSFPKLFAYG